MHYLWKYIYYQNMLIFIRIKPVRSTSQWPSDIVTRITQIEGSRAISIHYGSHITLQWFHNERDGASNHQPRDCLLNCLFRRRPKKTLKLRVGLCEWNLPVTGEFLAQRPSNVENVSIWWRHHSSKYIFMADTCHHESLWVGSYHQCRYHQPKWRTLRAVGTNNPVFGEFTS